MTGALARLRADAARGDVVRAIKEYDRLGPDRFFSQHGFGRSRSYELIWDERRYPHKAILGTAYEFATGRRLGSLISRAGRRRGGGAQGAGIHRSGQAMTSEVSAHRHLGIRIPA